MRDVIAGIDALVEEGFADPDRLGVTGGSYGGYLTNWIVGHDDRFAAAFTARSVVDLTSQFFSGDIGGPEFGREEFGSTPWDDPAFWRDHRRSPTRRGSGRRSSSSTPSATCAATITQAEELFAALRAHRRPARLMRVPEETHELTRSGTPFRRVENLAQVRDWFRHFLVEGRRDLPPCRGSGPAASPAVAGPADRGGLGVSSRSHGDRPTPDRLGHPRAGPGAHPGVGGPAGRRRRQGRPRRDHRAGRRGRPGRRRGAGRLPRQALDQAGDSKLWALDLAIRMIDLTTLEGKDTPGKVRALCPKAIQPAPADPTIPSVAAVCVYPALIADAKAALRGIGVKVASVATGFPSGQTFLDIKVAETAGRGRAGADEIDMVIDRGAFLSGDYGAVFDEIVAVKEACGAAHLKVILETGELET